MGCGHSKINIYPKRARNKANNTKKIVAPVTEQSLTTTASCLGDTELSSALRNGNGNVNGSGNECGQERDSNRNGLEECDVTSDKRTIRVKPFTSGGGGGGCGGPLLNQTDLSSSQQNFFKMLDEKIENGPDYDSTSETERILESARLNALLRDWETASAGSRSLPATPKRRPNPNPTPSTNNPNNMRPYTTGGGSAGNIMTPLQSQGIPGIDQIVYQQQKYQGRSGSVPSGVSVNNYPHTASVVHQTYGVVSTNVLTSATGCRYPPGYVMGQVGQYHHGGVVSSPLQYQAISPMYPTNQPTTYQATPINQPPLRPYAMYNQHGSPIKYATGTSGSAGSVVLHQTVGSTLHQTVGSTLHQTSGVVKHLPGNVYENAYNSSPAHLKYTTGSTGNTGNSVITGMGNTGIHATSATRYSNGDLIQQQLLYNNTIQQYHQQQSSTIPATIRGEVQHQFNKQNREQKFLQHQQAYTSGGVTSGGSGSNNTTGRSYQTSIHIPIVMASQQDVVQMSREQYEIT